MVQLWWFSAIQVCISHWSFITSSELVSTGNSSKLLRCWSMPPGGGVRCFFFWFLAPKRWWFWAVERKTTKKGCWLRYLGWFWIGEVVFVTTFCFFFFWDESWPSSDVLGGSWLNVCQIGRPKIHSGFPTKNSSKFWGGFEALPNRLRSVAIWRLKSVEWCNYW